MTSRGVEGTWIRTGGYGRFRGEWVNYKQFRREKSNVFARYFPLRSFVSPSDQKKSYTRACLVFKGNIESRSLLRKFARFFTYKILYNLCFSFLLGITAVPREIQNNAYGKFFWGEGCYGNKSNTELCT